ncbi:hypothetical protein U3516DRAFT_798178 [Neocallimastix sp. 'constans']
MDDQIIKLLKNELELNENKKNEDLIKKYKNNLLNKYKGNNIDTINSNLNDYLTCLSQYHLFANEKEYENVYQVLLMQIFIFCKIYGLNAEKNSGLDRYDFECENAINQIVEKKYKMKHEKNGYSSFIIYGITFWKRICRIEMKINNNDIKGPSESLKE